MLKTPSSFRSAKKRNPSLLQVFKKGGTAPNTPEEEIGVTVVANEFDPSVDLSPLSLQHIPSPLRGKSRITAQPSTAYKKEESPEDDVVSKTLNFFDDICAVPKTSDRSVASIIKQSEIRHPHLIQEPSYLIDDDNTTTPSLPSAFSSNSSPDLYSNYDDSSLNNVKLRNSTNQQHHRPAIPKSSSHDHENFEVVLDPASLLKEEKPTKSVKQQRGKRWPFSASASSQNKEKDSTVDQIDNASNKTSSRGESIPLPASTSIPATELRESPVEIQKNEVSIEDEENAPLSSEEEEVTVPNVSTECKDVLKIKGGTSSSSSGSGNGNRRKVLAKKIWKTCKKIPILQQKEHNQQHHRAEVDNEAAVARSLENKRENLEGQDFLQQGCPHQNVEPILEENEDDVNNEEGECLKDEKPSSMANAWKNIYTSITNTLDPELSDVDLSGAIEAASNSNSELPSNSSKLLENMNEGKPGKEEAAASAESVEVATRNPNKKVSNARSVSLGKRLKTIQKSAYFKASKTSSKKDDQLTKAKYDRRKENELLLQIKPVKNKVYSTSDPEDGATTEKSSNGTSNEVHKKPKIIWKAVIDSRTGKTYYYHRKTRETTWTKPDDYKRYEIAHKKWLDATVKQAEMEIVKEEETKEEEQSSTLASARSASFPKSSPSSEAQDLIVNASGIIRIPTPAIEKTTIISNEMPDSPDREENNPKLIVVEEKDVPKADDVTGDMKVIKKEVTKQQQEEKTETKPFDESKPIDESKPFDEPQSTGGPALLFLPRSPQRFGNRSMTYVSKASANTRSSALTDRTEKIKNTAKGRLSSINPINENMSTTTSISSRHDDERERFHVRGDAPPNRRVPSRVPVLRERQLMVEELTDARLSAESYEGNAGEKRGRIVRGRQTHEIETASDDIVYDGDNDTEEDYAFDNDTYGTDSVSALSENDTDFLSRRDNFDQARRRALDAAIEIEDWDLAAALSDGMRAANLPGGYEKAHSSWNQSELDKFIANNDWTAVKSYIARMREMSKKSQQGNEGSSRNAGKSHKVVRSSSTNKSVGARSQLQHKELMSESSWTSDSHSSYESYDSDSEI